MKENEPANCLAEKYKKDLVLSVAVKQKINEILEARTFRSPTDLAEAYLDRRESFPLPLRSKWALFAEKPSKAYKANTPSLIKKELTEFLPRFWESRLEEMRVKIGKKTLAKLEKNYDTKTINKILEVLIDFEPFVMSSGVVNVLDDDVKKAYLNFKKKHKNVINTTEFLLKKAGLSDSEKEVVRGIQLRHKNHLERLSQVKQITVDPIKEALLKKGSTPTLLTHSDPEGWIKEFFLQCHKNTVFKKPAGRPKKIIFNALVIVICRLLKNDSKLIKWLYATTVEIISQVFGVNLTIKDIDNSLHST